MRGRTLKLLILLLLLSRAGVEAADSAGSGPGTASKITLNGVLLIVSEEKFWSLDDLNKLALERLNTLEEFKNAPKIRTIVHVTPSSKDFACEFLYLQGFGQPYWRVRFNYEGKISSVEKRLKK